MSPRTDFFKIAASFLALGAAAVSGSAPVQARTAEFAPPPPPRYSIPADARSPEATRSAQQRPPVPQPKPAAPSAQPPPPSAATTPSAPERMETITYDNWTVSCRDTVDKASKKICSGTLQVIDQKSRQVLMAWLVGRDNRGALRTVIQTPTGVQIPKGLELKLGKATKRTLPFTACEPQRCEASVAIDEGMIKDATAASEVTATIYAVDGRAINFNLMIKGIDQVFAAIGK